MFYKFLQRFYCATAALISSFLFMSKHHPSPSQSSRLPLTHLLWCSYLISVLVLFNRFPSQQPESWCLRKNLRSIPVHISSVRIAIMTIIEGDHLYIGWITNLGSGFVEGWSHWGIQFQEQIEERVSKVHLKIARRFYSILTSGLFFNLTVPSAWSPSLWPIGQKYPWALIQITAQSVPRSHLI